MERQKDIRKKTLLKSFSVVVVVSAGLGVAANAQSGSVVLNDQPTRIISFETANMYHAGSVELNVGTQQTSPDNGTGTGNQMYFGGGSYAPTDRLTFGVDFQNYVDPIGSEINGARPDVDMSLLALSGKYLMFSNDRVSIAAQASVESFIKLDSPLFGGSNSNVMIGSFKAPVSINVAQGLQFHVTPSVSILPDTLSGAEFYGTIVSLGAGVSYKASERIALYGAVDVPLSGNNSINSSGNYTKTPVWVVGGRYNVTPKAALEAYVTNGIGISPATSVLTYWPDGEELMAGMRLVYTPGAARPDTYRPNIYPVTSRQRMVQQEGFTLASADVLEPGVLRVSGWYGSDNNAGGMFAFSPDRDAEIQVIFEQYSDSGSADANLVPTTKTRYMVGPKLRFMDQNNGDAFSLSGRLLYGRQIESKAQKLGVFYGDLTASYKTADERLVMTASPKLGAFGDVEIAGLGLGLNYLVGDAIELMAEITPVMADGDEATWAAGARYNFVGSGFSVDAMATNAIGRQGIGSMVSQGDTRFSLMLSKSFDLNGLKFY